MRHLYFAAGVCALFAALAPLAVCEDAGDAKAQPAEEKTQKTSGGEGAKKANDDPAPTHYAFLMKSGERVLYVKYVDFGDVYSVKGDDGKFQTVKKEDVAKIVEPTNPPQAEPVKRPPPVVEAKSAEESKSAPPKKPETAKPAAQDPPKAKSPAGRWVLKDGRAYDANQAIEAGDDWMIQTMDGRMVKFKKSDVSRVDK
ncbi:MAG: hypothetical protein HY291_17170 [Planctomycetes bacterium]|nr:hypothetical protein [Planctomycetota bacterium]